MLPCPVEVANCSNRRGLSHCRDNENAYVQVNGKTCWTKKLHNSGKQVCGSKNGGWNEDRIKVSCIAPAVNNQLTVRVYTALNSDAKDESFGIDNVVLKQA